MNPIYKPAGRALEYSPDALALNIYTGCNHGCKYCFAPGALRKTSEDFHNNVAPRDGIVDAVKRQLDKGVVYIREILKDEKGNIIYGTNDKVLYTSTKIELKDKLIHLCFTCDPYPADIDTTATREIIKAIKDSGNHVQILTKGDETAMRDFDLMDKNDWFGVSYTGGTRTVEPNVGAGDCEKDAMIRHAKACGINTWVSCEPVLNARRIYSLISNCYFIDLYRIGKLNHYKLENFGLPPINWGEFGRECERLCKERGRNYYIKNDLRKEMEKTL